MLAWEFVGSIELRGLRGVAATSNQHGGHQSRSCKELGCGQGDLQGGVSARHLHTDSSAFDPQTVIPEREWQNSRTRFWRLDQGSLRLPGQTGSRKNTQKSAFGIRFQSLQSAWVGSPYSRLDRSKSGQVRPAAGLPRESEPHGTPLACGQAP